MGDFGPAFWWVPSGVALLASVAGIHSWWRTHIQTKRPPRITIRLHEPNPQPAAYAVPGVFATIINERHDIPARFTKITLLGGHADSDEWQIVSRYSPLPHILPPDDSLKIQFDMLEAIERKRYDYLRVEVATATGIIFRSEPVRQFFR